jgi:hypothetical protein
MSRFTIRQPYRITDSVWEVTAESVSGVVYWGQGDTPAEAIADVRSQIN